eukprot:402361_1
MNTAFGAPRFELLGLSAHRNAYTLGALEGNWEEDRRALEEQQKERKDPAKFAGESEMKGQFQDKGQLESDRHVAQDHTRAELFAHGSDPNAQHFQTSTEAYYGKPALGQSTALAPGTRSQAFKEQAALLQQS